MTTQNTSAGGSPAAITAYLSPDWLAVAAAGEPAWSRS